MIARTCFLLIAQTLALGATTAPSAPASGPAIHPEAQKVIERALTAYRGLKSYQDKLVRRVEVVSQPEDMINPPDPVEVTLAWAAPNRLNLKAEEFLVISDGKTLWEAIPPIEQYIVSQAPAEIDLEHTATRELLEHMRPPEELRHRIARVLTKKDATAEDLIGDIQSLGEPKAESRRGQPGRLLSGVLNVQVAPDKTAPVPFTAWFNDKTGLLEDVRVDQTERVKEYLKSIAARTNGLTVSKYIQVIRYGEIKINEEIPAERFTFKPGEYDKQVPEFDPPTPQEYQRKLIGRPAPEFAGEDMKGNPIKLSDFKGRVVLLDFWATWCGPCLMSLPGIQRLAERFDAQPVTILGIAGDQPGSEDRVNKFIEDRKLTYTHVNDFEGDISEMYRVTGIPHVVLIDKQGKVAAIHNGYTPGQDALLARQIELLLQGKPIPEDMDLEPASGPTDAEAATGSGPTPASQRP